MQSSLVPAAAKAFSGHFDLVTLLYRDTLDETVRDRETGLLARLDDVDAFVRAIRELDRIDFDPLRAVENAERFSVEVFQEKLRSHVQDTLRQRRRS